MGCRLQVQWKRGKLQEAYQQGGRHVDMSAAIRQPWECNDWTVCKTFLGSQPILDAWSGSIFDTNPSTLT